MLRRNFLLGSILGLVSAQTATAAKRSGSFEVTRTDEEWRAMLSDLEYEVMRNEGTERAGTSPCLLYTSPSPRDGLLSRMPSSA